MLEQAAVEGALTWIIASQHPHRAEAERAANLHESPIVCWLLHDERFGWRRQNGRGWMHEPNAATGHGRADAEAIAACEPGVTVYVMRESGLVTCPDLTAAG